MKILTCKFLHSPVTSPQQFVLKHSQCMVRDQLSHPYKTRDKDKIIVLYVFIFRFPDTRMSTKFLSTRSFTLPTAEV